MVLRMLADRRDELGVTRTAVVSRLHRLLLELVPGGAKQFLRPTRPTAVGGADRRECPRRHIFAMAVGNSAS